MPDLTYLSYLTLPCLTLPYPALTYLTLIALRPVALLYFGSPYHLFFTLLYLGFPYCAVPHSYLATFT